MTGSSTHEDGADAEEQRLKERLAALEALHQSGELSDEEYAIARRLAIFGPTGSAAPDSPPAAKQASGRDHKEVEPPGPGGTSRGRAWLVPVLAIAALVVVALVVILVVALPNSDSATPTADASADGTTRTVRVNKRLTALFAGAADGRCFGPRRGASFTVYGRKQTSDFLNCGDDDPALATGTYTFRPLPDGTIKSFSGTFAIDEGSYRAQAGSSANFVVTYGAATICDVTAYWEEPATCTEDNLDIPTTSGSLEIRQNAFPNSSASYAGLWAGVVGGRIGVSTTQPATAGAPASGSGNQTAGRAVFDNNCQGCHPAGGTQAGVGPRLEGAGLSTAAIRQQIVNGKGAMPGGLVSGRDLDRVVAYVESLQ